MSKVRLAAVTAVTVGVLAAAGLPMAEASTPPSLNYSPVPTWWGTNGRVTDIVPIGDRVYLSGGFDYIGPQTGYGTAVDGATGDRLDGAPIIDGTVYASVSDGNGGWYVAGSFTTVDGNPHENAAHITATGTVTGWNPKPDGPVYALAVSSGQVVLGGDFTQLGKAATAVQVNNLAAVDQTGGAVVTGFTGGADGVVRALLPAGPDIYVGGDFTSVGSGTHSHLARIGASDGLLQTAFTAQTNRTVRALAAASPDASILYAGGDFTQASGSAGQLSRARLAAWSTSSGSLQSWAPAANASVEALAIDPDPTSGVIYAGGLFSSVSGAARTRLAAIDAAGTATAWRAGLSGCQTRHVTKFDHSNPPCTPEVSALTAANGKLYVGGRFGQSGSTIRHDAAAFTLADGTLASWDPVASDRVLTLGASSDGNIFLGGDLTSVNGLVRKGVAALTLSTGAGDPSFTANTDDLVADLQPSLNGSTLYLAGHFDQVNGVPRSHIAAVSSADGAVVTGFKANANNDALSLGYPSAGGALYATGQFVRVNGDPSNHAVKLNPATGAVVSKFKVSTTGPRGPLRADGMVQSMVVAPDGSKVYLAGPFKAVNGTSVSGGIVAVDGTTGALLAKFGGVEGCSKVGPWIVHLAISADGQRLYGGDVCPDRIYQWDAVDLTKSQNYTWETWCNGGMQGALEVEETGNFYYGSHGDSCWASPTDRKPPISRSRYAVFDSETGALRPDSPQFNTPMGVWAFAVLPSSSPGGGGLLVGGDFSWVGNHQNVRQGLVLFPGTP